LITQFNLAHWGVYGINYYAMAQAAYSEDKEEFLTKVFNALFGKHAEQYRGFYAQMRAVQESAGDCLLPYQRHLFNRTEAAQYEELLKKAAELPEDIPYSVMCERIRIWAEYLLRFKRLSDSAQNKALDMAGLESFIAWCDSHKGKGVIVLDRLHMYFTALAECLKNGKVWIHFNIDWEDDHIKKVDEYLAAK
jgi:hypothetical protein